MSNSWESSSIVPLNWKHHINFVSLKISFGILTRHFVPRQNCPDDLLFVCSAIFILRDMCMGSAQRNRTSTNFLSFKKRARSLINLFCFQPCSCYSFFHESKDLTCNYDLFRYLSEFDAWYLKGTWSLTVKTYFHQVKWNSHI